MSLLQKIKAYLKLANKKIPDEQLERWKTKSAIAASIAATIKVIIDLFDK